MRKLSLDALRAKAQVTDISVLEKISGGNKENCHCTTTTETTTTRGDAGVFCRTITITTTTTTTCE
jgi:hypothetical protein